MLIYLEAAFRNNRIPEKYPFGIVDIALHQAYSCL